MPPLAEEHRWNFWRMGTSRRLIYWMRNNQLIIPAMVAPKKDILWDRVISPSLSRMSAPAARAILTVRLPRGDIKRFNILSSRAKRGTLKQNERAELELYLDIGNLLSLMRARAHITLKRRSSRRIPRKMPHLQ